jgi:hypothetical protein
MNVNKKIEAEAWNAAPKNVFAGCTGINLACDLALPPW